MHIDRHLASRQTFYVELMFLFPVLIRICLQLIPAHLEAVLVLVRKLPYVVLGIKVTLRKPFDLHAVQQRFIMVGMKFCVDGWPIIRCWEMKAFPKAGRIPIITVIIVANAASSSSQVRVCCFLVVERSVVERVCSVAKVSRNILRLLSRTYLSIVNGRRRGHASCAAMMSLMCTGLSDVDFSAVFNMLCLWTFHFLKRLLYWLSLEDEFDEQRILLQPFSDVAGHSYVVSKPLVASSCLTSLRGQFLSTYKLRMCGLCSFHWLAVMTGVWVVVMVAKLDAQLRKRFECRAWKVWIYTSLSGISHLRTARSYLTCGHR